MKNNDIHNYDDIINMPHPVSKKHPQMSMIDRAAQFAPFAALTGHQAAIDETGRIPGERKLLDENLKERLNDRIQSIVGKIKNQPKVKIVYYQEDLRKDGWEYVSSIQQLKKYQEHTNSLIFVDGTKILVEDIFEIYEVE